METIMDSGTSDTQAAIYPWWLVMLHGLGAIGLGILLLTAPGATILFLVQALGLYWLVVGIFSIVSVFVGARLRAWKLVSGILGVVAGLLIISHPLWSAALVPTTLTLILGIYGLISGAVLLIGAIRGGGWGLAALGALALLLGIALISAPVVATLGLILAAGILSIVGGIVALINAFDLRRERKVSERAVAEVVRTIEQPSVEEEREKVESH